MFIKYLLFVRKLSICYFAALKSEIRISTKKTFKFYKVV